MSAMLRRASITLVLLCSLACATPSVPTTSEPAPRVVVESEPEPIENTAEALLAAADRITRVDICDLETREPIATLPPATLEKLRAVLRDGAVAEGLSSEPAWTMILRVEVEGRPEPFIVQFVTVALRVKPEDPWSLSIANEAGEIDWSIKDIYADYALELDYEFEALVPDAEPQRHGEEWAPPISID